MKLDNDRQLKITYTYDIYAKKKKNKFITFKKKYHIPLHRYCNNIRYLFKLRTAPNQNMYISIGPFVTCTILAKLVFPMHI